MTLRARTLAYLTCLVWAATGTPAWAQELDAQPGSLEEAVAASVPASLEEAVAASVPASLEEAGAAAAAEDETSNAPADLEAYWSRRLLRGQQRIALATERAEKAEADYSRARHDRDARGERLLEIKERHTAADLELREARESLPRLVEQARRAGVPPGILRDYWDEE